MQSDQVFEMMGVNVLVIDNVLDDDGFIENN